MIPGSVLGRHRPEENPAKCLIRSGDVLSPRQTSIDNTNDCVMKSQRGALVIGVPAQPVNRSKLFTQRSVICGGCRVHGHDPKNLLADDDNVAISSTRYQTSEYRPYQIYIHNHGVFHRTRFFSAESIFFNSSRLFPV